MHEVIIINKNNNNNNMQIQGKVKPFTVFQSGLQAAVTESEDDVVIASLWDISSLWDTEHMPH